jgi:DNA-binding transcriptional LysR family regulator
MELVWLEDFVSLSETGNFSRAAELRHVTQPAFSRRIRALEDWVGVPLFERNSHGVSLTGAGRVFRPGAEDAIRRIIQLCSETREAGGALATTLRFAATHVLSFTFFPGWIRQLEPAEAVNLISDTMQACEHVMLHGEAQFLLCHHHEKAQCRFDPEQFTSTLVGRDRLLLLSAPTPAGSPVWQVPSSLPVHYLAYSADSGLGRIASARQNGDSLFSALRPVLTSQLAATLRSMARDGRGLAWLPESVAQEDITQGKLVRAAGPQTDIDLEIRLFRPRARQSQAAEMFWSRLKSTSSQDELSDHRSRRDGLRA